MNVLIWIIGATFLVSLIAFVGAAGLAIKTKILNKILLILVGFSAGALMGGAFIHLIPEAIEGTSLSVVFLWVLIGFSLFFLIERVLKWHHCHKGKCDVHTLGQMNLIGDGVHNFIDGLIIAAAFLVNIPFGVVTTIAIISHEVPQEIGDFGVLVYGGFSKIKALIYNFLSALVAVIGAVAGYFLSALTNGFTSLLIPFAAGGFIYIAGSDLIPELHKERDLKKSILSYGFFIIGIIFMFIVKLIFGG
ncbi:ZIP family metal transporter [Candidatus Woesearchaeota archaeon]|nr:ZIP family metal transporter [Candidatus Woesearchaeota archaeon]